MSATRDQPSSRIPLSVKNTSTQSALPRDASLLGKPAAQQPLRGSIVPGASGLPRPRAPATASALPNFIARSHLGVDRSNQENTLPQYGIATPKKRAIPIDESHVRNVVLDSPSKRSRSSRTGTDSSSAEQSVSGALATDLNGIRVQDARKASQSAHAHASMDRVRASQQTLALAHATSVKTNRKVQEPSQEVVQESRRRQTENEIWRQKYKRAFPNFIFHFDSVDAASAKRYGEFILELGGHVDQFFSRRVTHVITTRQVPEEGAPGEPASLEVAPREPAPREPITSAGGCNAERLSAQKLFRPSFLASRAASTKAGGNSSRRPVPLFSERNPLQEPPRGQYGPQDMLVKAQSFGMRIWQLEKLQNVVVRLLNLSMRDLEGPRKKDLSKMLQMEKVYGTTERDPSAARSSFHYFDKHSKYILVEDATMEHRPIISHEYTYTDDEKAEEAKPPWPVVYGETLGRCPFTFYAPKRNAVKPRDGEDVSPLRLEVPQSLRRAVSLNNMARSNLGPAERPQAAQLGAIEMKRQQNPLASGNSVSITSNIASTTSNIFTDQQTGATVGLPQNRRVAELNRRVHMSNVYGRPLHLLNASPASVMAGSTTASGLGLHREGGNGAMGSPAAQRGAESGATVRRMLGLEDQRAPGMALQRSASTSAVDRPPSAKKPGYCENCRVKYEDFTEHIYDRKHRKFATNEVHFVDIDALIMRVQRPIRPSSEDELSSGFLEFEAIPSSQPEENVAYSDSDEELSAGSPEAEDDEAGEGEEMPASMRTHVHGAYA